MLDRATVLGAGQAQPYEVAAGGGAWFSGRRLLGGGGAVAPALVVGITGMEFSAAPYQPIQMAVGGITMVPLTDVSLGAGNPPTPCAVPVTAHWDRVVCGQRVS